MKGVWFRALWVVCALVLASCGVDAPIPFSAAEASPAEVTPAPPSPAAATTTPPTTEAPTSEAPTTDWVAEPAESAPVDPTSSTAVIPSTTVGSIPPGVDRGVLLVGDSILEGLANLGYNFGPGTAYDTEVARSALTIPSLLESADVPSTLVMHLGTNGWWPTAAETLERSIADLSDRRIVLVNLRVDRTYEALANEDLRRIAAENENVELVDWNAVARPEVLRSDGFHPTLQGYEILARLIADAIGLEPDAHLLPPAPEPIVPLVF